MIFALTTLLAADPAASEVIIVRAERLTARTPESDTITLSGPQLQDQAVTRLDEALRLVPGVGLFRRTSSTAANATIQGISLRPITPNGAGRALVSLDGVPQNDPFGGWIYWGRYDPLFLERVDIARGGAGAGFGPMALTGTLDLVEARGQSNLSQVSLGSSEAVHIAARGSVTTNGARFSAMALYDFQGGDFGLARAQRGLVDERLRSEMWAANLVTDIARPNGPLSFRASAFEETKSAGIIGGQSAAMGVDVSAARRIEGIWGQARFLVYGQGRDFSNQAVVIGTGRASATPTLDQFATPSSAWGGSIIAQGNEGSRAPRVTLDWRRAEGETQELFRYLGSAFTRARVAGGRQDLVGLGFQTKEPVELGRSGLRLDGTFRLDYWANSAARRLETDRVTGAVTLNEQPDKTDGTLATGQLSLRSSRISISAYRTFRPPTLNELHRPFRVGNDVTEANAALKPETLSGLDVDVDVQRDVGEGSFTGRMTFYANRLYGPVTNVTVATGPGNFPRVGFLPAGGALRQRQNAGRIDAFGLEASLNWSTTPAQPSYQISLSTTDARVDGGTLLPQLTGKRPAQAPRWAMAARGLWPLDARNSVSVILRGESLRFEDDLNSRRLPAYGALDLRYDASISEQLKAFISIENAFGKPVITSRSGDGIASLTQGSHFRIGLRHER
jgi:hypothetical protein